MIEYFLSKWYNVSTKNKGEKRMSKLDYEISKRYSNELGEIKSKLDQLERGRIYELSRAQMDGYLATNIKQLRTMIAYLLEKIQNDEQGGMAKE